jgi:beta-N-acetylhexosaminidase
MRRAIVCVLLLGNASWAQAKKPAAAKPVAASSPVERWLSGMTLRQQVAQLVVVKFYGEALPSTAEEYREYARLVGGGVGGMIVLNRVRDGLVVNAEPHAMAAFLNRMQRLAKVPLIVGGDFERGASMRMSGTVKFPHQMAYAAAGDLEGTRLLGRQTAREARAMGVHWIFAPGADVNNNPDNPVINLRSFGENPDAVARHVRAYIEGAHSDPAHRVLVCAKHFPGHGDTAVDSHLGLARVEADRARLEATELKPFAAAIEAGVDSIMTAHLAVPALEPKEIPATVSKNVLTNLLRKEMGFSGLITTDAMDMYGLSKQFSPGEAAVRAIEAGVDVLLIPPDPERAIASVVKAVESGRISPARIRQSVERVLRAKARLGLDRERFVNIENLIDGVDVPEAAASAQRTADRAVTLVRDEQDLFPMKQPDRSCVFVLMENRWSTQGRKFLEEVKARGPRTLAMAVDASLPEAALSAIAANTSACAAIYAAAFAAPSAYRGDAALMLSPPLTKFVETLLAGPAPVGLVSFGNPYLLRGFPAAPGYAAAFTTAPTGETAMAKALFGDIRFQGRMPVSIPGLADYGTGILK